MERKEHFIHLLTKNKLSIHAEMKRSNFMTLAEMLLGLFPVWFGSVCPNLPGFIPVGDNELFGLAAKKRQKRVCRST